MTQPVSPYVTRIPYTQPRCTVGPIELLPFKMHIRDIRLHEYQSRHRTLSIVTEVLDRDAHQPLEVTFYLEGPPAGATDDEVHHAVRAALVRVLIHELDELLLLNGQRINDPHKVEKVEIKL